jgi:hypothetical protein
MNQNPIIVTKNTEETEVYSQEKLKASLRSCGATSNQIDIVINQINPYIYTGISTNKI